MEDHAELQERLASALKDASSRALLTGEIIATLSIEGNQKWIPESLRHFVDGWRKSLGEEPVQWVAPSRLAALEKVAEAARAITEAFADGEFEDNNFPGGASAIFRVPLYQDEVEAVEAALAETEKPKP